MRLEAERFEPLINPSNKQIEKLLMKLRSYGPQSFASLTDEAGNYVQIAGGE
ncbi:UNVERIFIED_ORG: hypothetical protein ABIC43_003829 [Variovorax guangxiensis]